MLDADTLSYRIRGEGQVGARVFQHRPYELCISAITLAEFEVRAEAKRSQKLNRSIRSFIKDVAVIPFDEAAADRFALVAAALARRGEPIGARTP
jgi:tRNA(fMet)-specific endonuclease VapC